MLDIIWLVVLSLLAIISVNYYKKIKDKIWLFSLVVALFGIV
ncbi:hypothetical protein [Xenorhabdus bovienii]|nr:hypothetical protein [Xenorhabdus bovienii]